jgi:hypothetical protein
MPAIIRSSIPNFFLAVLFSFDYVEVKSYKVAID